MTRHSLTLLTNIRHLLNALVSAVALHATRLGQDFPSRRCAPDGREKCRSFLNRIITVISASLGYPLSVFNKNSTLTTALSPRLNRPFSTALQVSRLPTTTVHVSPFIPIMVAGSETKGMRRPHCCQGHSRHVTSVLPTHITRTVSESTKNAAPLKSTKSKNSEAESSVSRGTNSNCDFGFI